jgi:hypothetical protein
MDRLKTLHDLSEQLLNSGDYEVKRGCEGAIQEILAENMAECFGASLHSPACGFVLTNLLIKLFRNTPGLATKAQCDLEPILHTCHLLLLSPELKAHTSRSVAQLMAEIIKNNLLEGSSKARELLNNTIVLFLPGFHQYDLVEEEPGPLLGRRELALEVVAPAPISCPAPVALQLVRVLACLLESMTSASFFKNYTEFRRGAYQLRKVGIELVLEVAWGCVKYGLQHSDEELSTASCRLLA